jgi:hypothetical protein
MVKDHPAKVTAKISSVAASASTIIAAAADTVQMRPGTMMLIHNASDYPTDMMTAEEHQAAAADLEKWNEAMAAIYMAKTGKTLDEVKAQMATDAWMSAQEAVDFGLADEIIDAPAVTASADIDNPMVFNIGGRLFDFTGMKTAPVAMLREASPTGEVATAQSTFHAAAKTIIAGLMQQKMDERALCDERYNIDDAFRSAFYAVLWDTEMDAATKKTTLSSILDEYSDMMKAWVRSWVALVGSMDDAGIENAQAIVKAHTAEHTSTPQAEAMATAREDGIKAERERQIALDKYRTEATAEIIAQARQAGTAVGEVCQQIVEAGLKSESGIQFLQRRAADAHESGANLVAAGVAPVGVAEDAEYQAVIAAAKKNSETGRV